MRTEAIAAFMGLSDNMLEMLFVLPEEQGHGYGKAFVDYAINKCNTYKVDVNKNNTQAYRFYLHMGYKVIGRMNLILSVNLSLLYIYSSRLFRIQNFEFMHANIGYGEWFGVIIWVAAMIRGEKTRVYQIIV